MKITKQMLSRMVAGSFRQEMAHQDKWDKYKNRILYDAVVKAIQCAIYSTLEELGYITDSTSDSVKIDVLDFLKREIVKQYQFW